MNSFAAFLTIAMVTLAVAEPPSPYSYQQPSGGLSLGGGLGGIGGGIGGGFGGIGGGFDSNEGANVDPQLLEQVRQILLREESSAGAGGHGGLSAPSSQYGVPSPQYGVPSAPRVVNVVLEHTIPALQVASFSQQSYAPAPQPQYAAPQPQYAAPQPQYAAPAPQYSAPAPVAAAPAPQYSAPAPQQSYPGAPY